MGFFPNLSFLLWFVILSYWTVTSSLCMAEASVHYYDFIVKETNFTKLCSTKSILTVNDSFPGPEIRVLKGDTAYVNVHNHGDYGLTVHWHGVKQPRNPWYDGPEYVTQCAIPPGTNFTYKIIFSTEEGTLWWHAHSDWTRATVHGAIIIFPAVGTTYPFPQPDAEATIVLGNWFKRDMRQMVAQAIKTGEDTPRSDAYTINGQPGDLCNCSNGTTYNLMVEYGKTYLLRVVNVASNADLFFSIAQHNLTIVGTDGSYTKPFTTNYMMISTGKTIDILITADQPLGKYYMAARQYSSTRDTVLLFDHTNATAIINYKGEYNQSWVPVFPATTLPYYKDYTAALNFSQRLRSLASQDHPVDVPQNVTTKMFIVASMNMVLCPNSSCGGIYGNRMASSLNNMSWVDPSLDVLMSYYRNTSGVYDSDFPDQPSIFYNFTGDEFTLNIEVPTKTTKVKMLDYNETLEIVFQGTDVLDADEDHPMHLHGHSFYVVGSGLGNFDAENDPLNYNLIDPPCQNIVSVPKNGWAAIRFRASNPGVWYMHCHYDRHMTWGMNTIFITRNGGTRETSMLESPDYMPRCTNNSSSSSLSKIEKLDDSPELSTNYIDFV